MICDAPIAFIANQDPVRLGLVASLARPGGNLTGINLFSGELAAKRLDLLHDLLPRAVRVAVLVNPADATNTASTLRDVEAAARAIGLQVQVLRRIQVVQLAAFHRLPAVYGNRALAG
jgi:putative ABC transport system substrate-binding protein